MKSADAAWRPKANPWLIAVVVTLAAFMEILDTTIVNVSLPHIAGSVSASYDDATWTLTSYLVANGIVLPISGFIGRVIGRKRYFMICIAGFVVCSFLCGTATSLGQIVVYRLFQGFFGGGLQPNQQSIILDTFEPKKRGAAFGVVAVAVIFAPAIGPTLGGILTDTYSWRWIFWINIPVGIFALFAVAALVEDPPWVKRQKARIIDTDWIGLGLIAVGIGSLQVFMDRGEDEDWFGSSFITMMARLRRCRHFGRHRLADDDGKAGRQPQGFPRPQLRARGADDRRRRCRALFRRCAGAATCPAAARLYGDAGPA